MGYDVTVDPEKRILTCVVQGAMDDAGGRAMAEDVRARAAEHGYALLYDLTAVRRAPKMGEMYQFPRHLNEESAARPHKIAILCSAHFERYTFYETTAVNAGHNVRVFDNEQDAVAWAAGDDLSGE